MLASYVFMTILTAIFVKSGSAAAGSASVFFLFTFNAFYSLAGTALAYVYVLELLPYAMRTKGLAISNLVDQAARCVAAHLHILVVASVLTVFLVLTACSTPTPTPSPSTPSPTTVSAPLRLPAPLPRACILTHTPFPSHRLHRLHCHPRDLLRRCVPVLS